MAHETTLTPLPAQRVLRLPQVEEMVGLRRSRIEDLVRTGAFPRPIRLSSRAVAWWEHELLEWLSTRPRATYPASDGPPPAEA